MKAIDNKELEVALEALEKERGIKKEYLMEQIEIALITAYKNNYKDSENVRVVVDRATRRNTYIFSKRDSRKVRRSSNTNNKRGGSKI